MPITIKSNDSTFFEERFKDVKSHEDLRIYNIFTRYFSNTSDWYVITKKAKDMGFNTIYLNPINKTGSSGSLYSIADYFGWDKRCMGNVSREEGEKLLKDYLDYCKKLNMKVFYDLVVNHTAYDSQLVKEHDNWYEHDENGNIKHAYCYTEQGIVFWEDSAKLKYDIYDMSLFNYIESICNYYLELGFSGFRCDAAAYAPDILWKVLIKNVHKTYPNAIFIAETFMVPLENIDKIAEAGFEYIFSSAKWWNGYDSWYTEQIDRFHKNGLKLVSFPDNHDTERLMFEVNDNEALYNQRLMFIAVCSSSFEITYGFEYGFKKKPNVVKTTPEDIENSSYNFTKEIAEANSIRDKYEILRSEGKFCNIWPDNDELIFIEKTPLDENIEQKCLIIMNRTSKNISVSSEKLNELFAGNCIYKSNYSIDDYSFEPFGIHIFISSREENPCIKINQSYCLVSKGKIVRKEIPIKKFFPDEALVEILTCGICGSDRREFSNGRFFWKNEESGGHEFVGKVLQVGKKCSNVKVGDIVVNRIARDYTGITQFGGYSKYAIVKEKCLFVLPNNTDLIKATLIEPLACAVHIGKFINNLYKKHIAIIGSGTIALLTERYLSFIYPEINIDFLYKHSHICKYLYPKTRSIEFNQVFATNMFDAPNRYNIIIECSGNAKIFSKLFNLLNTNGKIILSGIYNDSLINKDNNISLSTMMFRENSILGSFLYTLDDFVDSANLILNGSIKVDDIITIMNFGEIQKAFEVPSSDRVKIILTN